MSLQYITENGPKATESVEFALPELIKGLLPEGFTKLDNIDPQPILTDPNSPTIVDVHRNHNWYVGPRVSNDRLDRIPTIFLTELEQQMSSLVQGAMYYLNAVTSSKTAGQIISFAGERAASLKGKLKGGSLDSKILAGSNLNSLQGIYYTEPTGFNYRLPYYSSTQDTGTTGSWNAGNMDSGVGSILDRVQDVAKELLTIGNITQPGVYIEKPKYFQQADTGKTIDVEFPLYNTFQVGTEDPVQMNYELLWLLAFQNKPYKTSFARTPPPKLYTVSVPGVTSMPYAYISSMQISFEGTTRNRLVSVPYLDTNDKKIKSKKVSTPVPDAYNVKLSLTSLIGDYGNQMLGSDFSTSIATREDGSSVVRFSKG